MTMTTVETFQDVRCGDGWAAAILVTRCVSRQDVETLRREIFPIGLVTEQDAEALIRIERHVLDKAASWAPFFVESLVDFVIWGERPTGVVTDARARWIMAQLDRMKIGMGDRLLHAIREQAQDMPAWFRFAMLHRIGSLEADAVSRPEGRRWVDAA